MSGSLLVAGCAIDLSGEKQPGACAHLEHRVELRRRVVIVLNGVTGAGHARSFETRHGVQNCELHGCGQRGREPVYVHLVRIVAFWLEEELMTLRARKLHDLVLNGWTVPRPSRRDGPAVHGGLTDVRLDEPLALGAQKGDKAGKLSRMARTAPSVAPSRGPEV